MCGIMGYGGTGNTKNIVLNGLSRLEYRGYDSAGMSFQDGNQLKLVKKEGKLANLEKALEEYSVKSSVGIGHTRWATHGQVNDINAHPHQNEYFSIVHNGIIENANELRSFLQDKGHNFSSETDSEVFLEMMTYFYKQNKNTIEAIWKTFEKLEGNSAFVIIESDSTKIYSIKNSAPVVCGLNSQTTDVYISSDPYALMGYADRIFFPEDGVLVVGDFQEKHPLNFYEKDGLESKRYKVQEKSTEEEVVSKGDFDHFMHKEIHEQPILAAALAKRYGKDFNPSVDFMEDVNIIHLVSCGTALYAGMVIKHFIESETEIKVLCDFASEFRYKNHKFSKKEVALFISQSGETADTLACLEICNAEDVRTFSVVNVEGSTLFRECDYNFLSYAGTEIGVASTKAFTQQVLVGSIVSSLLTRTYDCEKMEKRFLKISKLMTKILENEARIKKIAQDIYNYKGFIFTGRGIQYPIALEGALKLKEIAYVHAEGYASGELKHGPIALIDETMVNIAIITPDLYKKTYSNAQEVKARKGKMIIIGEQGNKELEELADHFIGIELDTEDNSLNPLLTNLVLQLLSYNIAKLKGTDIDKPRNLAKSVTVE